MTLVRFRTYTFACRHRPRLNRTAPTTASVENDTGIIAMNTPVVPSPPGRDRPQASGISHSQNDQKKLRTVGSVQTAPAPLNAAVRDPGDGCRAVSMP